MKNAILFWFYKDVDICINRLELIKKYNPDIPIHGLFGGDTSQIESFSDIIGTLVESFTPCFTEKSSEWKWKYGDKLIAEWYKKTGQFFNWDRIIIVQWDMLLMTNISNLTKELGKEELYISGLRPVYEVKDWWNWVKRDISDYENFLKEIRELYSKEFEPLCCQFIFVCLSRTFLNQYYQLKLDKGFIEYRLPTIASALGYTFGSIPKLSCYWPSEPREKGTLQPNISITAQTIPIGLKYILKHMTSPNGDRVFHPYYRLFPNSVGNAVKLLSNKFNKKSG